MAKKAVEKVQRIKSYVAYTTVEIAALLGCHCRTVQQWYREGLSRIDHQRPCLVLGAELRQFLETRRKRRKRPCADNELFCLRCRQPRQPCDNTVVVKIINAKTALLSGICSVCHTVINRITSVHKLSTTVEPFVVLEIRKQNMKETGLLLVNADISKVANHGALPSEE